MNVRKLCSNNTSTLNKLLFSWKKAILIQVDSMWIKMRATCCTIGTTWPNYPRLPNTCLFKRSKKSTKWKNSWQLWNNSPSKDKKRLLHWLSINSPIGFRDSQVFRSINWVFGKTFCMQDLRRWTSIGCFSNQQGVLKDILAEKISSMISKLCW